MDANVVAAVLLSAFIIDRLIAVPMYVASYLKVPREETAQKSEYHRKFVYFFFSAVLSYVALNFIPYESINLGPISNPPAKSLVMWLILVAGADRISEFIGKGAAPAPAAPKNEFRVTGTMTLVDDKKSA